MAKIMKCVAGENYLCHKSKCPHKAERKAHSPTTGYETYCQVLGEYVIWVNPKVLEG